MLRTLIVLLPFFRKHAFPAVRTDIPLSLPRSLDDFGDLFLLPIRCVTVFAFLRFPRRQVLLNLFLKLADAIMDFSLLSGKASTNIPNSLLS